MTQQLPLRRFTPCTETATDYPVLLIDSEAPLLDLHACLRERLNAALEHLNLQLHRDFTEQTLQIDQPQGQCRAQALAQCAIAGGDDFVDLAGDLLYRCEGGGS